MQGSSVVEETRRQREEAQQRKQVDLLIKKLTSSMLVSPGQVVILPGKSGMDVLLCPADKDAFDAIDQGSFGRPPRLCV